MMQILRMTGAMQLDELLEKHPEYSGMNENKDSIITIIRHGNFNTEEKVVNAAADMANIFSEVVNAKTDVEKKLVVLLATAGAIARSQKLHGSEDTVLITSLSLDWLHKFKDELYEAIKDAGYQETYMDSYIETAKIIIANSPDCPTCENRDNCKVWINAHRE